MNVKNLLTLAEAFIADRVNADDRETYIFVIMQMISRRRLRECKARSNLVSKGSKGRYKV